jgi:[ribosomal protein S5]-alanine N-acetyltransferase
MLAATESNNYLLRNLEPQKDDLNNYISWMTNTSQNKFIESVRDNFSIEQLKTYIADKNNSSDAILFGIFDKDGGKHIGNVKLEPIVERDFAWLGVLIGDPSLRGRGVGFEVVSRLMEFSRDFLHLKYITLGVKKDNIPALKLYRKLGFSEVLNADPQINGIQMKCDLI